MKRDLKAIIAIEENGQSEKKIDGGKETREETCKKVDNRIR